MTPEHERATTSSSCWSAAEGPHGLAQSYPECAACVGIDEGAGLALFIGGATTSDMASGQGSSPCSRATSRPRGSSGRVVLLVDYVPHGQYQAAGIGTREPSGREMIDAVLARRLWVIHDRVTGKVTLGHRSAADA